MFMDPSKFGAQFYDQMESLFVDRFKELLQSHSFLARIGRGMDAGLDGKKSLDDAMKQYLESVNMPTRDDIARILQYLHKIESRVIGLEEKLDDMEDELQALKKLSAPPAAGPPGTALPSEKPAVSRAAASSAKPAASKAARNSAASRGRAKK